MSQRVTPAYIARRARAHHLDPQAVLAVASQEGLGGGVGDHGTSFGPFQLHYGGAYPSTAPHGAGASQAWAWSPSGIEYALSQQEHVAGGQHGAQAVKSLVTGFERPADPGSEIQGALAAYGHAPHGGGQAPMAPGAAPESGSAYPARVAPDNRQQVALALLRQVGQKTPDYSQVFGLLEQRGGAPAAAPPMPSPTPRAMPTAPPAPHGGVSLTGQLAGLNPRFEQELEQAVGAAGGTKVRVDSGYRSPAHNAAVGGVPHSNHTTGDAADGSAYVPGQGWVPLGTLLRKSAPRFGLRSGDQPGFYNGGRDPVHVDDGRNQRRHR